MNDQAQAGILDRPRQHLLALALTLKTTTAADTAAALQRLRELESQELTSQLPSTPPLSEKNAPSADTGELGFESGYERYALTITTGFASRVYELLGVSSEQRPQDLIEIPWGDLGDQPTVDANGDVFLQVCSDSAVVNEHVLHRIQYELSASFETAWVLQGVQRHNSRAGGPSRGEGRALIGFIDGISNLDPRCSQQDAELVFVNPGAGPPYPPLPTPGTNQYGQPQPPQFPTGLRPPPPQEPQWAKDGTYVAVRASTIDFSTWDSLNLGVQEHTIGRFKASGQPLSAPESPMQPIGEPEFTNDPQGATTPLTAHIRKANPRGPEDQTRRIFRRGYPLLTAAPPEGLRRGLVFIAFARSLSTQFEFIVRAWTNNPDFPTPGAGTDALRSFETVLCGGYFFIPPLEDPCQGSSWVLPT